MKSFSIYLNFDGNCHEAFTFYQSVFGGNYDKMHYRILPPQAGYNIADADKDKIMHCALSLDNGHILMGSDRVAGFGSGLRPGNDFHINISTESMEESQKIFTALSEQGTVTMPLNNMFWGAYFGMCRDQFGVQWMINFDPKNR